VFLMHFMPHVVDRTGRWLMFGCMLLGSLMIVAMSSWLNASALAGAAAIQQHLAITVQNYTRDLDTANSNAIAAQGLLPDIQLASSRFAKLADAERAGSLTGTAGSGTVVQLLTQMSGQLDGLGQEVQASGKRVSALYEQGGKHLAKMREWISDRGPISSRSDAFAAESLALMGVIANLQQTSVAPAVKRAATMIPAAPHRAMTATFSPDRCTAPVPNAAWRPEARWASGNTLPICTSESGSWSVGMKTPEMKARRTVPKGAIVAAESAVVVMLVSAIPSAHMAAVQSSAKTATSAIPSADSRTLNASRAMMSSATTWKATSTVDRQMRAAMNVQAGTGVPRKRLSRPVSRSVVRLMASELKQAMAIA